MVDWNPADHPRGHGGKFADSFVGRLSGEIADQIASKESGMHVLGPQGEFDGPVTYRVFPSSVNPKWENPLDPTDQVRASEDALGGIGKWYDSNASLVMEYSGAGNRRGPTNNMVMVAVRFRSSDLSKMRAQSGDGIHGDMPTEPLQLAVVGMKISQDGQWRVLDVPPDLTTVTHGVFD